MVRRDDKELGDLLEKYVCIRLVQMWGADLSLFQFDYNMTWAALMMNADKTMYGRYGTRSDLRAQKDISLEGFKKALEGALALHQGYPANKKSLAGKIGPAPQWKTPESIPAVKPKRAEAGDGCIHCHRIKEGEFVMARSGKQPIADRLLWSYPMPEDVGLQLDVKERATVAAVAKGSAAEKSGFKAADRILQMNGQPILSIADVQWVLQQAKEPGTMKVDVDRGGEKVEMTLAIEKGFRRKSSFLWTTIGFDFARPEYAGFTSVPLPPTETKSLGLSDNALALKVTAFPPGWLKEANRSAQQIGLKAGDVITEVDGLKTEMSESEFLATLVQKKSPGQKVDLTFLRNGKAQKAQLSIPASFPGP